jgi:hypothetical protein
MLDYLGGETEEALTRMHLKLLAHFGRWINILASHFDDSPPTTACVISQDLPGGRRTAIFASLSSALKSDGLAANQAALENALFIAFQERPSPLQLHWSNQELGHCAEIPGLL